MKIIKTYPRQSDFGYFTRLRKQLYRPESQLLKGEEQFNEPLLKACFVALKDDIPKARLALYQNPLLQYENQATVCLGNYESDGDEEAAHAVLDYAMKEAKKLGAKTVLGPMNGSTWDNYRFNQSNKLPLFLMEQEHPTYYVKQFETFGFTPIKHYFSSIDRQLKYDMPHILEREDELVQMGVKIRAVDTLNYEQELGLLYPFLQKAFQRNFAYSPISWDYFKEKYMNVKALINPQYVLVAENSKGEIIGFMFALKDLLHPESKQLIIKTVARKAGKKWAGLGHIMSNQIYRRAVANGIQSVIHAFIMQNGFSTKMSNRFSGEVFKKYVLYGKSIE